LSHHGLHGLFSAAVGNVFIGVTAATIDIVALFVGISRLLAGKDYYHLERTSSSEARRSTR
jgi:hypothetical protein